MEPASTNTQNQQQPKKSLLFVGIFASILIFGAGVFLLLPAKTIPQKTAVQQQVPTLTPSPTIPIETQYENPFDKNAQYENPFSESGYENPFESIE